MISLPDTFAEAVGLALKEWRTTHAVTQVEAAKRAEVSQPTLSRWERGLIVPTLEEARKLCGTEGAADLMKRADCLLKLRESVP